MWDMRRIRANPSSTAGVRPLDGARHAPLHLVLPRRVRHASPLHLRETRPGGEVHRAPRQRREASLALLALIAAALLTLAALPGGISTAHAAPATGGHLDAVTFTGDVDASSAHFLDGAISTAEHDGSALLLITIDTPGGDIASMEDIVQHELASTVPIVTYVAPQGAHAGSAGTFITLAAPLVAMAPDTRIGAASPVDSSGNDIGATLDRKIKNDLEALIRRVQTTYGRNSDLAAATVETAAAYDDQQAISQHLVNLGATSQDDLLRQLDGLTVTLASSATVTLHTGNLAITTIQPSLADNLESLILDPTVLFILFIVAAICIYLELAHPGAIVPGTIGAIALVIFLFGAGSIDPNWAGLVLMLLAIVLLAVDVRVPTHGVLTAGALISLVVGSLIFFNSNVSEGAPGLSPIVIAGAAIGVGIVSLFVIIYAVRSQRWEVRTGGEGLLGQTATVLEPLAPAGRVRVLGEDWAARLATSESRTQKLHARARVRVREGERDENQTVQMGAGEGTGEGARQPITLGRPSGGDVIALEQPSGDKPNELDQPEAGGQVRIIGRDGLTLIVEPLPPEEQ